MIKRRETDALYFNYNFEKLNIFYMRLLVNYSPPYSRENSRLPGNLII